MKILYSWLQDYIECELPSPEELATALTMHSSEIESIVPVGSATPATDWVIDVKVTPDRAHDLLSHRGVAREVALVLPMPLSAQATPSISALPTTDEVRVTIATNACTRYAAALVNGIKIGPSPVWLRERLEALGHRSINNVIDATNYVMLSIGQPLHAFDADSLTKIHGTYAITVRDSRAGETLTTLDGIERTLPEGTPLITETGSNTILGLAGIKGGVAAEVTDHTQSVLIEAAHFDAIRIRQAAKVLGVRTEASVRFENHITATWVPEAVAAVVALIKDIAGSDATNIAGIVDVYPHPEIQPSVKVSLNQLSTILGALVPAHVVAGVLTRSRCQCTHSQQGSDTVFVVTPPADRLDILIPEDVADHIARVWGYENVLPASLDAHSPVQQINPAFYYASRIAEVLGTFGFSEIATYTFRDAGEQQVLKPLAADKKYLRKNLSDGMSEALDLNIRNADILGLAQVKVFEIGNVFVEHGEHTSLALGVRNTKGVKDKEDAALTAALTALSAEIGVPFVGISQHGMVEINLSMVLTAAPLPTPAAYATLATVPVVDTQYAPFSLYPFSVRDVAVWVPLTVTAETIESIIRTGAGTLLVRLSLFDTFKKELVPGVTKTSFAFRLVLQSGNHTLTESEITAVMQIIYDKFASHEGWTIR